MENKKKHQIFWDGMCPFMSGWEELEDMEERQLMGALQFAAKQERFPEFRNDAWLVIAALSDEYERRNGKMDADALLERLGL